MPNTGKPSRGCKECKDRKVKCDQAPNACNRCARNGRNCSGYPSPADLAFRNSFVVDTGRASESRAVESRSPLTIPSPVPTDWHQQAICMFLRDYIIDPFESKINFGHLQTLPNLLSKAGPSSALSEAVSAVALTSLAHRSSLSQIISAGRNSYGKALRLLGMTFTNNGDICGDQTLATVLCLDLYEWVSGERPSGMIWSNHVDVLETLLRARNHHRRKSISKGLTYTAHSYLVEKNLSRTGEINSEALLSTNEEQEPIVIKARLLNYEICKMAKKANSILKLSSLDAKSLESLSEMMLSGASMDKRFNAWENEASQLYQYQTFAMASFWPVDTGEALQGVTRLHVYDTISVACMWNNYRTSRNYLLRLLIRISTRLNSGKAASPSSYTSPDSVIEMQRQSQTLANDVYASVPYVLGEVDQNGNLQDLRQRRAVGGLFLLWPLGSLLHLHFLPPEQIAWIKERVTYIRDALGIQQAKAIISLADR